MKRNIETDFEFDKVRFAEVLRRAIGERSIAEFARFADVSTGYVSRYVNLKVDVAPTLTTMQKLNTATTSVTYEELLEAAGYDPKKYDDEASKVVALSSTDWSPMNALLPTFCKTGFKWQFVSSEFTGTAGGPIAAKVEGAPFDMWYFIPVTKDFVTKEDISAVLGSDRAAGIAPGSKVTFLTASQSVFDEIVKMELNLISLRISAAYIESNSGLVTDEKYVKTAVEITDLEQKFVLTNTENENNGPLSL